MSFRFYHILLANINLLKQERLVIGAEFFLGPILVWMNLLWFGKFAVIYCVILQS